MVKQNKPVKKQEKTKVDFPVHKIKIKIIGVGGGASSIVADIASHYHYRGTKFVILDTDVLSLSKFRRKKELKIFQFGEELTRGMGTGMDIGLAREAAEKDREKIKKLLGNCDLCILLACLGGGTASGATPLLVELSNELNILSYGIFTLPFGFERERKMRLAKESLKKMEPLFNAITVVPNERIFKMIDKKTPLRAALSHINKILGLSLGGLIEMIYNPGLINIDFADIRTIMNGKGSLAYLNRVQTQGKERAQEALTQLLNNPLYPHSAQGAKRVLFNISGPQNLSLSEVAHISQGISNVCEKGARVVFGVESSKKRNLIDVTLLAVGCGQKTPVRAKKKRKRRIKKKEVLKQEEVKKQEQKADKKQEKESKKAPLVKKPASEKAVPAPKKKKATTKKARIRKNALELQKALKEAEKELLAKEEIWETPAFLRIKKKA
jgi:cell division protein FtsZ